MGSPAAGTTHFRLGAISPRSESRPPSAAVALRGIRDLACDRGFASSATEIWPNPPSPPYTATVTVVAREPRTRPLHDVLAQVRARHDEPDCVLWVRDLSRSGVLLEVHDLAPPWMTAGRTVKLTLVAEGGADSVELAGPIVRVDTAGPARAFAVAFDARPTHAEAAVVELLAR